MGWWGPWHNGGGFSRDLGGGYQAPQSASDNEFRGKSSVFLHRPLVAEPGQDGIVVASPEQAMRNPKSFTVLQPIPGQSPKPLFTVCAYSLDQARALVAARSRARPGDAQRFSLTTLGRR
jgi:hypothetical protein